MTANVIVTVEREFDNPRSAGVPGVDRAGRAGAVARLPRLARRARDRSPVSSKLGGRHHHVKVRDADPTTRVTTDGVYTEFFEPDVFVSRERITGDPGIDPDVPLELRVEFTKMGRNNTLVRIIQGPYEPDVAGWHGEGWEKELARLADYLDRTGGQETTR